MVDAICLEIILRKSYLGLKELNTIYFGGGTPSSLPPSMIRQIIDTVYSNHPVADHAEITLEANPDDLVPGYLDEISKTGINRLSIGVQSFFDEDLLWMNRTHDAGQAFKCIELSREAGFSNLNVDLIYGLPDQTINNWSENIENIIKLDIPHVSAYHLTYEPGTVLNYRKEKKYISELDEETSINQYTLLVNRLKSSGFIHYEISNFAKKGFFSTHNLGYWNQQPYIGIGPSAHSYNGISRQWNYARNKSYIEAMNSGSDSFETELLDDKKRYHEYIMTSLRTIRGADLEYIKNNFNEEYLLHLVNKSKPYIVSGDIIRENNKLTLTENGKLISDHIIQDLFL